MADKVPQYRYPKWLSWPLQLVALIVFVLAAWNYLHDGLQVLLLQAPDALRAVAVVDNLAQRIAGPLTGTAVVGEDLLSTWIALAPTLLRLHILTTIWLFVAALIGDFLPALRVREHGLQVRRAFGWTNVPWDHITMVDSMTLPAERLVLLVRGRRWRLGAWFRLYSLLWGGGLRKGLVIAWHISNFDRLADALVGNLRQVYGEHGIGLIIDDMAYSLVYAFIFLPQATWRSLFTQQRALADAYAHPKWLHTAVRIVVGLLLAFAIWRYLGVWWRFLAGLIEGLRPARDWPVLGFLLRTFGPISPISTQDPAGMGQAILALVLAQLSMVLVVVVVHLLLNLFPNWLLGAEGLSVRFRQQWLSIPWDSIVAIRETLFSRAGGIVLLQVDRKTLTMWHVFYSLFYGGGLRRGVLFTSFLPGFEELRQRVNLAALRAREAGGTAAEQPTLAGEGVADHLLMARDPAGALRQLNERLSSTGGRLFKASGGFGLAAEVPWDRPASKEEKGGLGAAERRQWRKGLWTALTLAVLALVLVLIEELLFLPLSRPLALFELRPIALGEGLTPLLVLAIMMGGFLMLEWVFGASMLLLVIEMLGGDTDFRRQLALYPRIQSPRLVLAVILLVLGIAGMTQPLFFLWTLLGAIWGGLLLWLAGRELYRLDALGSGVLLAGYSLFQGLVLLIYFLFH